MYDLYHIIATRNNIKPTFVHGADMMGKFVIWPDVIQQGRIPLGGDPIWHALTKKESENKEK